MDSAEKQEILDWARTSILDDDDIAPMLSIHGDDGKMAIMIAGFGETSAQRQAIMFAVGAKVRDDGWDCQEVVMVNTAWMVVLRTARFLT